jgi:hypothetical protein
VTIQQLQNRYQRALENRRNTREALRLATELNAEAEHAFNVASGELHFALGVTPDEDHSQGPASA